ncbi:MAG: ThuA domain-containing protein [Bryobacteraceae bacterium]|nr:ThuA domain-containing protein [Bryobacteraceae bacterium]MDW8378040.1 ThuA domain-containing protein [Bryobacterales bacterium]
MLIRRRELLSAVGVLSAPSAFAWKQPYIVFVCGDHEYSGEQTLALLAREITRLYQFRCTVLKSEPDQNSETNIPGLDELNKADLAVFFLRWRRLPEEQVAHIERYMKAGKPMFGFRTTSHAFNYPPGHPLVAWNAWGAEAFGTPPGWGKDGHTHFGHQASTDVRIIPEAARHPILTGVAAEFHVRSWLYRVLPKWPPADAERLLMGKCVNPNKPAEDNPVAWTWRNRYGGRVFFTTMGHPEDFSVEPFQRLVVNAIHWCLDRKPPRKWPGLLPINVSYRGIVKSSGI